MTLRRRSLLGGAVSSPRRTAQTIHRRALQQSVKQLTKPGAANVSSIAAATAGVQFGSASKANLKVVVRVRPLNSKEQEKSAK